MCGCCVMCGMRHAERRNRALRSGHVMAWHLKEKVRAVCGHSVECGVSFMVHEGEELSCDHLGARKYICDMGTGYCGGTQGIFRTGEHINIAAGIIQSHNFELMCDHV